MPPLSTQLDNGGNDLCGGMLTIVDAGDVDDGEGDVGMGGERGEGGLGRFLDGEDHVGVLGVACCNRLW